MICGAGIAGISAAYYLVVRNGLRGVYLVDNHPPLSVTSDKSTECYRNWWPGPGDAMVALMNRSIDLMEELARQSGNVFQMNRRGYLYVTADSHRLPAFISAAKEPADLGAGSLRVHRGDPGDPEYWPSSPEGFEGGLTGADLILDPDLIRAHFPYLTEQAIAALHVRRAGWFSAQQLGAYLLDEARQFGAHLLTGKIDEVKVAGNRVEAVHLEDDGWIYTSCFINAAGPFLKQVGRLVGVDLPVFSELHLKASFKDPQGVIARDAPLLIWNDSQSLDWNEDERALLAEDPSTRWLLEMMPAGAHTRPEGGADSDVILALWEYADRVREPVWPPPLDWDFPEIALRGLSTMVPGLKTYIGRTARPFLDGGYYTKTPDNRPLIGPLPVEGAYVIGALSGYGLMAACAAGELLAMYLTGQRLSSYAPSFSLDRYEDQDYLKQVANMTSTGQL